MFEENKNLQLRGGSAFASKGLSTFVTRGLEISNETHTDNGGLAYKTTGNDFVDQFGKLTGFRAPRSFSDVSKDMSLLCSQDLLKAVQFAMYIRTVSRKTKLMSGERTSTEQIGQGLRNEGIMRYLYLGVNHPETFKANLKLWVSIGSWKDIFRMMEIDVRSNGFDGRQLDWDFLAKFIMAGLENPETSDLVKKYLPRKHSNANSKSQHVIANTYIANYLTYKIFGQPKKGHFTNDANYRKLKSSGTAHVWQQLISKRLFNEINFDTVAGRALSTMVSSNFLAKNNLEAAYTKWIESKPVAKYTGYVYELMSKIKTSHRGSVKVKPYEKMTINAQFKGLVDIGRSGLLDTENGFLPVLDTSSSMTGIVPGTDVSAYSVGLSMALYFSHMLKSEKFGMTWMEFNNQAKLNKWTGNTPYDQYLNSLEESYGSTNLTSVAELFVKLLRSGVHESDFPSGVICISDGEFNRSMSSNGMKQTAYKTLISTLSVNGFSREFLNEFKVVFWDIPNGYGSRDQKGSPFQSFGEVENLYYLSGLDGSVLKFLLGREIDPVTQEVKKIPKTAEELFLEAMDQEILNLVVIK